MVSVLCPKFCGSNLCPQSSYQLWQKSLKQLVQMSHPGMWKPRCRIQGADYQGTGFVLQKTSPRTTGLRWRWGFVELLRTFLLRQKLWKLQNWRRHFSVRLALCWLHSGHRVWSRLRREVSWVVDVLWLLSCCCVVVEIMLLLWWWWWCSVICCCVVIAVNCVIVVVLWLLSCCCVVVEIMLLLLWWWCCSVIVVVLAIGDITNNVIRAQGWHKGDQLSETSMCYK